MTGAAMEASRATWRARVIHLGPWLLVAAIGAYLGYENSKFQLFSIPVGLLAMCLLVPGIAVALAAVGRVVGRPARWAVVALAAFALGGLILLELATRAPGYRSHLDVGTVTRAIGILRLAPTPLEIPLAVAAVSIGLGLVVAARLRSRPRPVELLAFATIVSTVITDTALFQSVGLRDLRLYLLAGSYHDHGLHSYLAGPLTMAPADPVHLPFLYPPFTLPFFGALATLPFPLVARAWLVASIGAVVLALRLFGLSWRWTALLLLWPPVAEGIHVGNAAIPAVLLFAAAPWAGSGSILGAAVKLQSGRLGLWLVRQGRWRSIATGAAMLVGAIVVTWPVVGLRNWQDWFRGLMAYRDSQDRLPELYGYALGGLVPEVLALALAAAAVALALRRAGREGLMRFGLATVVASPSLYSHGFVVALQAFLSLSAPWFWATMALTTSVVGGGWWAAVAIAALGWFVPSMRHQRMPSEALHPLRYIAQPWPRGITWRASLPRRVAADEPASVDV